MESCTPDLRLLAGGPWGVGVVVEMKTEYSRHGSDKGALLARARLLSVKVNASGSD